MTPDDSGITGAFVDTPHGRLYRPLAPGWQILVLIAAFFGGEAAGDGLRRRLQVYSLGAATG
jgi:hypothetical protein